MFIFFLLITFYILFFLFSSCPCLSLSSSLSFLLFQFCVVFIQNFLPVFIFFLHFFLLSITVSLSFIILVSFHFLLFFHIFPFCSSLFLSLIAYIFQSSFFLSLLFFSSSCPLLPCSFPISFHFSVFLLLPCSLHLLYLPNPFTSLLVFTYLPSFIHSFFQEFTFPAPSLSIYFAFSFLYPSFIPSFLSQYKCPVPSLSIYYTFRPCPHKRIFSNLQLSLHGLAICLHRNTKLLE